MAILIILSKPVAARSKKQKKSDDTGKNILNMLKIIKLIILLYCQTYSMNWVCHKRNQFFLFSRVSHNHGNSIIFYFSAITPKSWMYSLILILKKTSLSPTVKGGGYWGVIYATADGCFQHIQLVHIADGSHHMHSCTTIDYIQGGN